MVEPEVKLELWRTERVFVREVQGKYSELVRKLYERPRVVKGKKILFKEGPVFFNKFLLSPKIASPIATQAFEVHIEALAPGGKSQRHTHMNSANVYVLEGTGYDIHDGVRLDWKAGDAFVIRNNCVHQHFNADSKRPARVLIIKSKPLFMFFNLFFQKNIDWPSESILPGWEGWTPDK